MTRSTPFALALVVFALGAAALNGQAPVTASDAWVREPVTGRSMTAAYVVLENTGAADLHIVAATADVAAKVELHEMVRSGDMMKMAPVPRITVPARGRVELKPGGLHLMLFELRRPLKEGEAIELTFTTDSGAAIRTKAAVRKGRMPQ